MPDAGSYALTLKSDRNKTNMVKLQYHSYFDFYRELPIREDCDLKQLSFALPQSIPCPPMGYVKEHLRSISEN